MNDDNNLTPEELEKLQNEEAQQKTGPSLYDRLNDANNSVENVRKIKNIIDERRLKNAADTARTVESGASASGAGTAAGAQTSTVTGTAGTAGAGAAGAGAATGAAGAGAAAGTAGAGAATGAAGAGAAAGTAGAGAAAGTAGAGAAAGTAGAAGAGAAAATPVGIIVIAVIGLVALIIFLILFFSLMYYNVIEPISSKYSISEKDLANKYDVNFVGDEDCEDYTEVGGICNASDTDVDKLDDLFNGEVSLGLWQSINHLWYQLTGNLIWDVSEELASLILKEKVDEKLEVMGKIDNKRELPMGTLISTLAYTYSSQYLTLDYKDYNDVINFEGNYIELPDETRVNPTNPASMLASLLNEDILSTKNPNDIGDLLDNMVFHEFYPTYSWGEIRRDCEYDENGEIVSCIIYMGCSQHNTDSYKFDLYKYYLYLRYGAYVSGYAVDSSNVYEKVGSGKPEELWGKTGIENYNEDSKHYIAFGYEYFKNLKSAYVSSSEECELMKVANESIEELNASAPEGYEYEMDESSVEKANDFFKERDVTNGNDKVNGNHEIFDSFSKYDEKAEPFSTSEKIPTVKVDNTKPNGNGSFAVNFANGENYKYKYGWIYNRFPFYREEFQLEENKEFEYDEVVTPKDIERFIENIDDQKDVFDVVLGYDTSVYSSGSWSSSFNSDGTESFPLAVGTYTITSCFGTRVDPITGEAGDNHGGIDIAASSGTPIYSWKSGVVVISSMSSSYGNYVVVDHGEINGENFYTLYAHMTQRSVSAGDTVQAGQQLGTVGSTGNSTGPHLHFEIRTGGTSWLDATRQDPYSTLAEIVGDSELGNVCVKGTKFNVESTLINGTESSGEAKKQLCDILVDSVSENGAIALMANAAHESGYNTGALGDSGTSYGLFQWHNERKQNLMSSYPNSYNTVQSQYNFLMSELNGYLSLYSDLLSGEKSSKELAYDFCYYFERPANKEVTCKNRSNSAEFMDAESYVKNGCK